ncbi:MAG: substrate-binding domain-containing protein [Candidatus Margulisbacteria bacterium]|nr:substrate-binding domain-containing protein [Candidatus Margulisiibacteriota bacterium]
MFRKFIICWLLAITLFSASFAASQSIILATTTSTVDSGLLDVLLPIFEKQSGSQIKPIGVGSGMAMEMGRRGKADVLLVHSPKDEAKLVQQGFGINRRAVMHNDFVLLGPPNDPAQVRTAKAVGEAFKRISDSGSNFVSRGDRSGTHSKELAIWPHSKAQISNLWYLESGQGMGATLLIADQKYAYTLSDRATYLSYKDRLKLVILCEGDALLLNPYHIIEVNPEKWPEINRAGGKAFADFMVAPATQKVIANFGKEKYGQPLFFPDAK